MPNTQQTDGTWISPKSTLGMAVVGFIRHRR